MARTLQIGRATDDVGPKHPTMYANWLSAGGGTPDDVGQFLSGAGINSWVIKDGSITNLYVNGFWQTLDSARRALTDTGFLAASTFSSTVQHALATNSRILFHVDSILPSWMRPYRAGASNTLPADFELYQEYHRLFGLMLLQAGCVPDRTYITFRNEIDTGAGGSAGAFTGALIDAVEAYSYGSRGIKLAHPGFRVGLGEFGNAASSIRDMESGRRQFTLQHMLALAGNPPPHIAGGARLPLDVVQHHLFIGNQYLPYNRAVKRWISDAGYSNDFVEEYLGESALLLPGVISPPPKRFCDHRGATVIIQRDQLLQEAGVDLNTQLALREGTVTSTNGYESEYGLYVNTAGNATVIPTTYVPALRMMSMLGNRVVNSQLSQDAYDAMMRVTCTASGRDRFVLITRASYSATEYENSTNYNPYFTNECQRLGLKTTRLNGNDDFLAPESGLADSDIAGFLAGSVSLSSVLPAGTVAILNEAKARTNAMIAVRNGTRDLVVNVDDPENVSAVTVYEIRNSDTNNPVRAWDTAYAASGGVFNTAKAAALAQGGALTASFVGTSADLPYTVNMETLHSVLFKFTGSPSAPNNTNTAEWTPKPVARVSNHFLRIATPPSLIEDGSDLNWDISEDQLWIVSLNSAKRLRLPDGMKPGAPAALEVTQLGGGSLTLETGILLIGPTPAISKKAGVTYITGFVSADGTRLRIAARGPFPS